MLPKTARWNYAETIRKKMIASSPFGRLKIKTSLMLTCAATAKHIHIMILLLKWMPACLMTLAQYRCSSACWTKETNVHLEVVSLTGDLSGNRPSSGLSFQGLEQFCLMCCLVQAWRIWHPVTRDFIKVLSKNCSTILFFPKRISIKQKCGTFWEKRDPLKFPYIIVHLRQAFQKKLL